MTDRELLEKAAKAAGYQVNLLADNPDHWYRWDTPDKMIWNPLTYNSMPCVKPTASAQPGPTACRWAPVERSVRCLQR